MFYTIIFIAIISFSFTHYRLADLVANSKPVISNLATKSHLIWELPQHCEMMVIALKIGKIWCPSKKRI